MTPFDLTNRIIVVTGSRGMLGRPICAALAEAGADVIGLDAQWLTDQDDESHQWECDVLDRERLQRLLPLACYYGRRSIHGLVLLHGIDAPPGQNAADPWRDWQAMIDVNLTGVKNVCQVFGTAMVEAGRGSIVTVGSLYAGLAPDQRMYQDKFEQVNDIRGEMLWQHRRPDSPLTFTKPAAYSASKSGVLGLTRWMAAYWASSGVRVNCLSPGGIGSDATPAAFRQRFESRVPLGRMGTPGDLVGAIVWLLSDASAYVTGQEILCDGGFSVL